MSNTALAVQKKKLNDVRTLLTKSMPKIATRLPKLGLDEQALAAIAFSAITENPKTLDSDANSLVRCVLEAAQLGLTLDKSLGHAYLVPFKGKVQMLIGYRGRVALMDRSGFVKDVVAECAYEGDLFEYEIGMERDTLRWKPLLPPAERTDDRLTHAFAIVRLVNGGIRHVVLDREDILAARNQSSGYQNALKSNSNDSPWIKNFPEMAKKTAIHRVSKLTPQSPQMVRAARLDEDFETGKVQILAPDFDLADDTATTEDEKLDAKLYEQAQGDKKETVETLRETMAEKRATRKPGPVAVPDPEPQPPVDEVVEAEVVEEEPPPFEDEPVAEEPTQAAAEPQQASDSAAPRRRGRPRKSDAPQADSGATAATPEAKIEIHKGDMPLPPKERLKTALSSDVTRLANLTVVALGYEREAFGDVYEREAVVCLQHLNQHGEPSDKQASEARRMAQ